MAPHRRVWWTIKTWNFVLFIHRDLRTVWELEHPHLVLLDAPCGPLWGSDSSSEYARSWHFKRKNTPHWCNQSRQGRGRQRGATGELRHFRNNYLTIFLCVSSPSECWTELNFAISSPGTICSQRGTVSWELVRHPSVTQTLRKIKNHILPTGIHDWVSYNHSNSKHYCKYAMQVLQL